MFLEIDVLIETHVGLNRRVTIDLIIFKYCPKYMSTCAFGDIRSKWEEMSRFVVGIESISLPFLDSLFFLPRNLTPISISLPCPACVPLQAPSHPTMWMPAIPPRPRRRLLWMPRATLIPNLWRHSSECLWVQPVPPPQPRCPRS